MSVRFWLPLLALLGCGPAPGYEPVAAAPVPRPAASATPRAVPTAEAPAVPAPAITAEKTAAASAPDPACERARRLVAAARELADEGWVRRPLRSLKRAAALCPASDDAALTQKLRAALEPTTDLPTLERQLAAAEAAGDGPKARRLSAVWITAQRATRPTWWRRPAARVVGAAADLSTVVLAADKHGSRDPSVVTLLGPDGRPTHVLEPGLHVLHADRAGDRLLLSGGERMEIWSLSTGQRLQTFSWTGESYIHGSLVDGGRRVLGVASLGFGASLRLYDAKTGDSVRDVPLNPRRRRRVEHVAKAGHHLALGTYEEALVVNAKTLRVVSRVTLPSAGGRRPSVKGLALTGKGRLAVLTSEGKVRIYDGFGAVFVNELTAAWHGELGFAEGGKRLLWASDRGGELKTFDVPSGRAIRSRPVPAVVAYSADGERLLMGKRSTYGAFVPGVQAREGKAIWPTVPDAEQIQGLRVTEGLVVARELRRGSDAKVELWAWHHGERRHLVRDGYRANILAMSPSGRQVAAVLGRQGILWDLARDRAQPFDEPPGARGFPDQLVFEGEERLRLAYERPLTTHQRALPDGAWAMDQAPSALRGFGFAALSPRGGALSRDDGALTLAPDRVLLGSDAGHATFSGDGSRIFAVQGKKILWFDEAGQAQGEVTLSCEPYRLTADAPGALLAFGCDRKLMTLRPPRALATLPDPAPHGVDPVYQDQRLSPGGHLLAQRTRHRVRFVSMLDGKLRAELEVLDGHPVIAAVDGRLAYAGSPDWVAHAGCRIGHRVYPLTRCEDALRDDGLVGELVAPP